MYTAALAKMFVGVLPLALLMHMSTSCYMLGNADILNIGFVRQVLVACRVEWQHGGEQRRVFMIVRRFAPLSG